MIDNPEKLERDFRDMARALHERAYELEQAADTLRILNHPDVFSSGAVREAKAFLLRWIQGGGTVR